MHICKPQLNRNSCTEILLSFLSHAVISKLSIIFRPIHNMERLYRFLASWDFHKTCNAPDIDFYPGRLIASRWLITLLTMIIYEPHVKTNDESRLSIISRKKIIPCPINFVLYEIIWGQNDLLKARKLKESTFCFSFWYNCSPGTEATTGTISSGHKNVRKLREKWIAFVSQLF